MTITTIKRSSTIGALNRRFQRNMEFQQVPTIAGPAYTHAGDNSSLALRYGTYPPKTLPRSFSVFGLSILLGKNANSYAELSDMESNWLIIGQYIAVGRK